MLGGMTSDHSPAPLSDDLLAALTRVAGAPRLLVVSDFDGTLAPFVTDPSEARAIEGGAEALSALAELPDTWAALVSGRAIGVLAEVSGAPARVELVGSHGAEFTVGMPPLDDSEQDLLTRVRTAAEQIVAGTPGALVEQKPTAAVVHVRAVEDGELAASLLERALSGPGELPGVHVTEGKSVVEMAVREAGKGRAIEILADRHAVDATVFIGDDVTDEHGFAVLGPEDLSIKVGPGDTLASHRADDIPAVLETLETLHRLRRTEG